MIWAQKLWVLLLRLSWGWTRSPAWDLGTWSALCARNDIPMLLGGRWFHPSFFLDDPSSRKSWAVGLLLPGMCRGMGEPRL